MSQETSDVSGQQTAQAPGSQSAHDEARRRAKSRLKLRMAQAVAAVLGVLILLVVGLMVYLAFSKYADRQRAKNVLLGDTSATVQSGQRANSQDAGAFGADEGGKRAGEGLVPADCRLASSALDGGRLVLIFEGAGEGAGADCLRLIILNTNTGALVMDRALTQPQTQE